MNYADHKVKVTVTESHCPKYKEGDVICFEGAMLDKEKKRRRLHGCDERDISVCLRIPEGRKPEERSVSVHGLR